MIGRLLLLLALGLALVLWWKHSQRGRQQGDATRQRQSAREPEAMLRCAECGVHLPTSQALPGKGGVFCGDAHRAAFEARDTQ